VLASSHDNGGVEVLLKDLGTGNTWTFEHAGSDSAKLQFGNFSGGYLGLFTITGTVGNLNLSFTLNGIGCKDGWRGSGNAVCKGQGY